MTNPAQKRIFVIGDLVIDHTIFIKDPEREHDSNTFEVISRMDTAGGAAHCARILAVLNEGPTFLWGLVGKSNWGDFRTILEHCQMIDGSKTAIKLRGIQDETHAQMNTVTRLIKAKAIETESYGPPPLEVRFDDYGHVHIPEDKRETVLHYLERVQKKYNGLDAILISDLDMNCLKVELVQRIADFAERNKIPLFVNPKYDRSKYVDIKATAIIPNLAEWCHLVGQSNRLQDWERNLDREHSLHEMAQYTIQFFGKFQYHIIECGELGAVIIAPDPEKEDRYAVYRARKHVTVKDRRLPQLGYGDILAAVFALEFSSTSQDTRAILEAFKKANAAVACYRDTLWQRMPNYNDVIREQERTEDPEKVTSLSKGMLFLPKKPHINLADRDFVTEIPGLVSVDTTFRRVISEFLDDIRRWLGTGEPKSIILGAPSGCGKSTIKAQLAGDFGRGMGIELLEIPKNDARQWQNPDEYFSELLKNRDPDKVHVLIAIDEALKSPWVENLEKYGVPLLNSAHAQHVRFLFIDTKFTPDGDLSAVSEFTSRCVPYYLPAPKQRPADIPYIAAEMVFALGRKNAKNFRAVKFEAKFLMAIISATLSNFHLRVLETWMTKAYEKAVGDWSENDALNLRYIHLPSDIVASGQQTSDVIQSDYEFYKS